MHVMLQAQARIKFAHLGKCMFIVHEEETRHFLQKKAIRKEVKFKIHKEQVRPSR